MMRSTLTILALGALAGCSTTGGAPSHPAQGIAPVNVPVVTSADYAFDAAAPSGSLAPGEAQRLNDWFRTLGLGYGDVVYVDGGFADPARGEVAELAGRYGLLVEPGAPMTAGMIQPGSVRVVVSRRRAVVPNCPNWSVASQPNYENRTMSNFGCSVNSNLAAMVANPVDLIHGREGAAVGDTRTAVKALDMYRSKSPTGSGGLPAVSTKGN